MTDFDKLKNSAENIKMPEELRTKIIQKCEDIQKSGDSGYEDNNIFKVEKAVSHPIMRTVAGIAACAVIVGGLGYTTYQLRNFNHSFEHSSDVKAENSFSPFGDFQSIDFSLFSATEQFSSSINETNDIVKSEDYRICDIEANLSQEQKSALADYLNSIEWQSHENPYAPDAYTGLGYPKIRIAYNDGTSEHMISFYENGVVQHDVKNPKTGEGSEPEWFMIDFEDFKKEIKEILKGTEEDTINSISPLDFSTFAYENIVINGSEYGITEETKAKTDNIFKTANWARIKDSEFDESLLNGSPTINISVEHNGGRYSLTLFNSNFAVFNFTVSETGETDNTQYWYVDTGDILKKLTAELELKAMPDLKAMPADTAVSALKGLGVESEVIYEKHEDNIEPDHVYATNPDAGEPLTENEPVKIYAVSGSNNVVSNGNELFDSNFVPEVIMFADSKYTIGFNASKANPELRDEVLNFLKAQNWEEISADESEEKLKNPHERLGFGYYQVRISDEDDKVYYDMYIYDSNSAMVEKCTLLDDSTEDNMNYSAEPKYYRIDSVSFDTGIRALLGVAEGYPPFGTIYKMCSSVTVNDNVISDIGTIRKISNFFFGLDWRSAETNDSFMENPAYKILADSVEIHICNYCIEWKTNESTEIHSLRTENLLSEFEDTLN